MAGPKPTGAAAQRDAGRKTIIEKKSGREIVTAVGPVARLDWLSQVRADRAIGDADLRAAIALQSFVNREHGFAFCGEKALADACRVATRTGRLRLANLIARGHVMQQRRGNVESALFLVLHDRQNYCRSDDDSDRQEFDRSEGRCDRQKSYRSNDAGKQHDRQSTRPSDAGARPATIQQADRQESGNTTGKAHFWNAEKSEAYSELTRRNNSENELTAVEAARSSASAASPIDSMSNGSSAGSISSRSPADHIPVPASEGEYGAIPDTPHSLDELSAFEPGPKDDDEPIVDAPLPPPLPRRALSPIPGLEELASLCPDDADIDDDREFERWEEERRLAKERREEARDAEVERARRYAPIDPYHDDEDIPF